MTSTVITTWQNIGTDINKIKWIFLYCLSLECKEQDNCQKHFNIENGWLKVISFSSPRLFLNNLFLNGTQLVRVTQGTGSTIEIGFPRDCYTRKPKRSPTIGAKAKIIMMSLIATCMKV